MSKLISHDDLYTCDICFLQDLIQLLHNIIFRNVTLKGKDFSDLNFLTFTLINFIILLIRANFIVYFHILNGSFFSCYKKGFIIHITFTFLVFMYCYCFSTITVGSITSACSFLDASSASLWRAAARLSRRRWREGLSGFL